MSRSILQSWHSSKPSLSLYTLCGLLVLYVFGGPLPVSAAQSSVSQRLAVPQKLQFRGIGRVVGCWWISASRVLVVHFVTANGEERIRLSAVDLKTGKSEPIDVDAKHFDLRWFWPSPDSRLAVSINPGSSRMSLVDLSQLKVIKELSGSWERDSLQICWRPDSTGWVQLGREDGDVRSTVFRISHTKGSNLIATVSQDQVRLVCDGFVGFTRSGQLLVLEPVSNSADSPGERRIGEVVLGRAPGGEEQYTLSRPDWVFGEVSASGDGNKLAWSWFGHPDRDRSRVVCQIVITSAHCEALEVVAEVGVPVGGLLEFAVNDRDTTNIPTGIRWSPDLSKLSYVCGGRLWLLQLDR